VKINFFADDTLLYVATKDLKEAENIMNAHECFSCVRMTIWINYKTAEQSNADNITSGKKSRINNLLRTMKWMNIKQRVVINTLLLIHKMKMKMLPKYLCGQIQYVRDFHDRQLQNSNDMRPVNVCCGITNFLIIRKRRWIYWNSKKNVLNM
jgi:hypothetical protein